jgi:transcription-repair coupling factor (superfamily II helicase)
LVGDQVCLFYPVDELLRANTIANNKEMLAQRLYVMGELIKRKPMILITHTAGALRYVPSPQLFTSLSIPFKVGGVLNLDELKQSLSASGYQRVNKVDQSLQFAMRGDILDIASVNLPHPIRIEFFGNEIESIRYFDIATQTSFESVQQCQVLPASEILFSREEFSTIENKILKRLNDDVSLLSSFHFEQLEAQTESDISSFLSHHVFSRAYRYYGFLQDEHFSILHYQQSALTLFANDEQIQTTANLLMEEGFNYFSELSQSGLQITRLQMYQELSRVTGTLPYIVRNKEFLPSQESTFQIRPVTLGSFQQQKLAHTIQQAVDQYQRVTLLISTQNQLELVEEVLKETNIDYQRVEGIKVPDKGVAISIFNLDEGFEIPSLNFACVTSKELFGYRQKASKYFSRYKEATIIQSHEDLKVGDYVVHEYSGIGQFLGVKTIEIEGIHKDYLHIQYAGTDVLYVPLSQFKLVRKYSGKEGAAPKLHKLQSKEWENTKRRIKEKVNDLAERLVVLYKNRAITSGYAFKADDEYQVQFEKQFPYGLTPDQQRSVDEIKQDMEKPFPMDRLLCGDVGFGKTEVAFRAAFKALNNHKQVAILCPTTLLARQHYERAVDRFASFGIEIAIFSRLIPDAKQKEYKQKVKEGKIQLIIGTHKLLGKEIQYNDLGLLIVDEEQRFGVEQKEKIKEIKANIDVLTLSATPIPRTLQISLLGIRQLSQINTSPQNRVPIQTYVMRQDAQVVKELIERELAREGQVYYLHNKVEDIYQVAEKLSQTIKGSKVAVVHGQMDKDEIEDVMVDFYTSSANLLVCTSIIENGIDIPNANLIIVEDASNFGLSQLYQIKGRVGRGSRVAYAYLLYEEGKRLNEQATKRLKAIQEFTELGSGYKIAQRDLMIRGAGDILGPEQAGFIDTVGLDMYLQLLNEAIEEKKTGIPTPKVEVKPSLMIDAYIPEKYAQAEDKVNLYQLIEETKDYEGLISIEKMMKDLYGRLPEEVLLLLKKRHFDMVNDSKAIHEWKETAQYLDIFCSDAFTSLNKAGTKLFEKLQAILPYLHVHYADRKLRIRLQKKGEWFEHLMTLLQGIVTVFNELSPTQGGA